MSLDYVRPLLGFVWRHDDFDTSIANVVRSAGCRAILDFSYSDHTHVQRLMSDKSLKGSVTDVKLSSWSSLDPALREILKEFAVERVWVDAHPFSGDVASRSLLNQVEELQSSVPCVVVAERLELVSLILDRYPTIRTIALKGNEASGFVGTETLLTLYHIAKETIDKEKHDVSLFIWGGIATPEAAAAFLTTGAAGVVFESIHWMTDLVRADDECRRRISKLRHDHTEVVGTTIGVPCRLFNRGNSTAIKELKEFCRSPAQAGRSEEAGRLFAERIRREVIHPLSSSFGRTELLPLGIEATFAKSFVERFGTRTSDALRNWRAAVDDSCARALEQKTIVEDAAVAVEMGTRYPIIQGAMTWITDVDDFARLVADAGALPTLALGLMGSDELDSKFESLSQVMESRPFAVNILGLDENPFRDEQLSWIVKHKPRFAVIAAGEPSLGAQLPKCGVEVMYIAPTAELCLMAVQAGIRFIICEGNEAGGHVGVHSTLTLAQIVLELKRRSPALFEHTRIVLAGGIHDGSTAFMAAALGADAVQMGTAYLATQEIVETGALTELYQSLILEAPPGSAIVTGESTENRIRALKSPKTESIRAMEENFLAGAESEFACRQKIEQISAGGLFIAARGLDRPGGTPLAPEFCKEHGHFMSGSNSGLIRDVKTLDQLHRSITQAPADVANPFLVQESRQDSQVGDAMNRVERLSRVADCSRGKRTPVQRTNGERIAITGMSCWNALGNTPEAVFEASLGMKSGIGYVPKSRWPNEAFYHPSPGIPEKTYCKVGAFCDFDISRQELGVSPPDYRTMSDATKLSMKLASVALKNSSLMESGIPPDRVSVILSQNGAEMSSSNVGDISIRAAALEILESLLQKIPLSPKMQKVVTEQIKSGRTRVDDTTLIGRLNSAAVGYICTRYGVMGPSYTVRSACSSSLAALFNAIHLIRAGTIDAAVVGGGEDRLCPAHFLEFAALGALAGLRGVDRPPAHMPRPFDEERDGLVFGEGGAMIVIERESFARSRGAAILAYVTGIGGSNCDAGIIEPSSRAQEMAMKAAFRESGYGPDQVDYIECHATGTYEGDQEELKALSTYFDSDRTTHLSAFKSQIGHTIGAAGLNSLVRGVMAARSGVVPPSLNYHTPNAFLASRETALHVATEPIQWGASSHAPRRFQVNAFGFGGSNFVVQLEQGLDDVETVLVSTGPPRPMTAGQGEGLPKDLALAKTQIDDWAFRVATVAEDDTDFRKKIERIGSISASMQSLRSVIKALSRDGIYLLEDGIAPPSLAFVFPGQGSHYSGMGRTLYKNFPEIRFWLDTAAALAEFDLLEALFRSDEMVLRNTVWQQPALFALEYAISRYLFSLGIQPAALAGHSLGELSALCAAEVFSFEDGFRIVSERARIAGEAAGKKLDPGIMMAVNAPISFVEEHVGSDSIFVASINSPHQVVVGGPRQSIDAFASSCHAQGYDTFVLRISMAFHSAGMKGFAPRFESLLQSVSFQSPRIPVVSSTTGDIMPADPDEIRAILVSQLGAPVQWFSCMQTLHSTCGAEVFLEVGPGRVLSNLVEDIIPHATTAQTCIPEVESLVLKQALASLFAVGHLLVDYPIDFITVPGAENVCWSLPARTAGIPEDIPEIEEPVRHRPASIQQILRREIDSYVLATSGPYLKGNILRSIREELHPDFTEKDLESVLAAPAFDGVGTATFGTVPSPVRSSHRAETRQEPVQEGSQEEPLPDSQEAPTIEKVIAAIVDATGYDRDEIDEHMDLREDLAIRSTRLPLLKESFEKQFGIEVHYTDFMHVRTVRDVAARVEEIILKGRSDEDADESGQDTKRIVFVREPVRIDHALPLQLNAEQTVAIFSGTRDNATQDLLAETFQQDYGVRTVKLGFLDWFSNPEVECFDVRKDKGMSMAAEALKSIDSLAGIVFVIDRDVEDRLECVEDCSATLNGLFHLLKLLVRIGAARFALLVQQRDETGLFGRIIAEGMLGVFLTAGYEYPRIQFRSLSIQEDVNLSTVLQAALETTQKLVEIIYEGDEAFTRKGIVAPVSYHGLDSEAMPLGDTDVVVVSGGGRGITYHLARSLVPFGPKLVLLGRTDIPSDVDFQALLSDEETLEPRIRELVHERTPGALPADRLLEVDAITRAAHLVRNIDELKSLGLDVTYIRCDVSKEDDVRHAMERTVQLHGKVDALIMGAGVIKDNFVELITADHFLGVLNVKLLGAWNLFHAAKDFGLRSVVGLSSIAAILGSMGQSNYCAANRTMTSLLEWLSAEFQSVRFTSLNLPPIAGVGMAENRETRSIMKTIGASYLSLKALPEIFLHGFFAPDSEDVSVMFAGKIPSLPAVSVDLSEPVSESDVIRAGTLCFRKRDFPLIDFVVEPGPGTGSLTAHKTFSLEADSWLGHHRPLRISADPIVSAIMILESFFEASRILYPYLQVCAARDITFADMIECPPGMERPTEIHCRLSEACDRKVVCETVLSAQDLTASGRLIDRASNKGTAFVVLAAPGTRDLADLEGFPIIDHALAPAGWDSERIQSLYDAYTCLTGWYRPEGRLDEAGRGAFRGRTKYLYSPIFPSVDENHYQYPAYLLESVFHSIGFYYAGTAEGKLRGNLVPAKIAELEFVRNCEVGETIVIEARLVEEKTSSVVWNARAVDENDDPVMQVRGLAMSILTF